MYISNNKCSLNILLTKVFWKKILKQQINPNIRMISEGSCDAEDCSNDAKNSALITVIHYKNIFKNCYFKL